MDLKYSYTVFKDEDFVMTPVLDKDELERYDFVDYNDVELSELRNLFAKYIDEYKREAMYSADTPSHWFFKDFYVKEKSSEPGMDKYIFFSISDFFNDEEDKDDRNLTISLYNYYEDTDTFEFDVAYRLKLVHVYQAYLDLKRDTNRLARRHETNPLEAPLNRDQINLYVYPVYLQHTYDTSFHRISTLYYGLYNDAIDQFTKEFNNLTKCIRRFIVINQMMYSNINNKDKMIVVTGTKDKKYKVVKYFKEHATCDKHVVINIDKVNVGIVPKRKNIYSDLKGTVCRRLCDYRYQVTGYLSHRWHGSKKDNTYHLEPCWVKAHYRNEGKQYNIIKKYKKG